MKKRDYIELLRQTHAALEAVTDRVGCDLATAKLLCDVDSVLKDTPREPQAVAIVDGLSLVH